MVRSLARQPSSLAAFAMAMALPLMTMGLRAVLCMRACARLYCASEGGFVGGRSRRALLRGRVLMRGAVLWAWLFGRRMVAPDFVLGFRRHCHFRTRAIAYSLALSLSKKKESHVATSIHPSHYVCVPREHLTVRTNRLINEWFVLFVWSSCNFFATSKGSN